MKKSCVIYATWIDQVLNLPDDAAGQYVKAIFKYAIYGEDTELDNTFLNAMLVPVKKKLDEDLEKYQAQVDRVKAISKRGRNEVDTKSIRSRNEVEGVTDTVTVTDTVKKNKKGTFHDFPQRTIDYSELKKAKDSL